MFQIPDKTYTLERRDGTSWTFLLRQSEPSETGQIMDLQEIVLGSIEKLHLFEATAREELEESIFEDACLSVYCGGKLCAFTVMVINRITPRHLGRHLGYTPDELKKSVTYDATFVHPDYRGFGMQSLLFREKDDISLKLGADRALVTVSPENGASLKNARNAGFEVIGEKVLYSGVNRYIMIKELHS